MKRKGLRTVSPVTSLPSVYYPVFLNLRGKRTVVIGGGKVAERKVLGLLYTGASVTVISPDVTERLEREKSKGSIKHIGRRYRSGDLNGAYLVIAATDSTVANEKVAKDAPFLVNVVDVPKLCNFIVPSLVKRGSLTIAVATGGVSPALSKSLRKELEKMYGSDFSRYLGLLKKMRAEAMEGIPDKRKRGRILKALASEKIVRDLRQRGFKKTRKSVDDLFDKAKDAN